MGVFWAQSGWEWVVGHSGQIGGAEWPNTPSCDLKAGQRTPRGWVGPEAAYQSEHATSGQAGLSANGKQGLRGQNRQRGRKLAPGLRSQSPSATNSRRVGRQPL